MVVRTSVYYLGFLFVLVSVSVLQLHDLEDDTVQAVGQSDHRSGDFEDDDAVGEEFATAMNAMLSGNSDSDTSISTDADRAKDKFIFTSAVAAIGAKFVAKKVLAFAVKKGLKWAAKKAVKKGLMKKGLKWAAKKVAKKGLRTYFYRRRRTSYYRRRRTYYSYRRRRTYYSYRRRRTYSYYRRRRTYSYYRRRRTYYYRTRR